MQAARFGRLTNVAALGAAVSVPLIDYLIVGGATGSATFVAGSGGNVQYAEAQTAPAIGSYSVVRGAGVNYNTGNAGSSFFNGVTVTGAPDLVTATPGTNAGNYSISGASLDYGTVGASTIASRGRSPGVTEEGSVTGENGCVIIRYLTGTITATGGTITTSGGYTIHTFTSNGTWQRTA